MAEWHVASVNRALNFTAMEDYEIICKECGSTEVAKLEWINMNTGEPYDGADPGVYTEWCFSCENETQTTGRPITH